MSIRTRAWPVGVVALIMATVLPQVAAVANTGDSADAARSDLPRASQSVGSNFRISGAAATGNEGVSAVAYNSAGNQYLVVWSDTRKLGTRGYDIYGQRFAGNGTPIGTNIRISSTNTNEYNPSVAYNPTINQYLVVWQDDRDSATRGDDIYGQRVKTTGNLAGGDFRISEADATGDEGDPTVVCNPSYNQYLIVWRDDRDSATRGWEIFGRRFKGDGKPAGGEFRISGPAATTDEYDPSVTYNSVSNQYLAVWEDERDLGSRGWDVYGRRIKASGKMAGGDFRISGTAATSDDGKPEVACNSTNNQFLVVWADFRDNSTRQSDIYGRRVKAGGKLAGDDFRISGTAGVGNDMIPEVDYNPITNQYLAVWQDGRNLATRSSDIFGRRIKASGRRAGGDFRISGPSATFNDIWAAVAANPTTNQYLVTWRDGRSETTRGHDIYGQRITG